MLAYYYPPVTSCGEYLAAPGCSGTIAIEDATVVAGDNGPRLKVR